MPADIPMDLTREQLEERLAALHQASLELVQDISLESLLKRIAVLACEQVQARYAAVGVLNENGTLERFIPIGMTPKAVQKVGHPPVGKGLIGALMHHPDVIRQADMSSDPRSVGFPPHHPPMRSLLGVPIRLGERQLGQIYLTDKAGGVGFSAADQQVIETLAAYAAVAISNARLYGELELRDKALIRRNEDLALLNSLAATLASALDIDSILNSALNQVVDYLKVEAGEIFLKKEGVGALDMVLHLGSDSHPLWTRTQFTSGEGLVGMTARTLQSRSLIIPQRDGEFISPENRLANLHQITCFPMSARSGVVGVLCVATHAPRLLDEREIQFLTAISAWVGTTIENVRLNLQGRRLAVLEERERIGMDLHDGIIQSIYAVGLTLEHARLLLSEDRQQARARIDQAVADLNATIRDIRSYILDLRPRQMHEENLMEGLQRLVNEFRANSSVEVTLTGPAHGLENLPYLNALALFHICQEAMANVAKHAHATRLNIYLWTTSERALLEISDDGRGFDTSRASQNIGHGLSNMRTRAQNVGGDVEFTSEPGQGTTVLVWVPIPHSPSADAD